MRKGILTDDAGDLKIQVQRNAQGLIMQGLVIGDVRSDIVERILQAYPGEFKEKPMLGCNVKAQLNGIPSPFWRGNAISQLQSEGLKVQRLDINETGIEIELED